jgi:metallopeptidase family M12-like protein
VIHAVVRSSPRAVPRAGLALIAFSLVAFSAPNAFVGLIVDDASGCGLSTRVAADSEDAYFVVHHSCATITISIAHEIGHILGARHDRAIDANNMPFAYAMATSTASGATS